MRVDTTHLPGKDAFALWQEEFVPYWEVRPMQSPAEKFQSTAEIHHFGEMVLGKVTTPAQWIDRSRYRIARDGFTQYGIQIVAKGRIGRRDEGPEAAAREPGDILISDLAQCSASEASDLSALFFSVPRDILAPLLTSPDHHNQRVISGRNPLASLLRSHLFALHEQAETMSSDAARAIIKPTLDLTAAVLNDQPTEAEVDSIALALTLEIRRYLEGRLTDRGLSADTTARYFGISPRKLYYLFESFGGFAAYVRERRLHHVRVALGDPSNLGRSIAQIAERGGFGNYAGFVRAFRRAFEMSPREARVWATEGRSRNHERARNNAWSDWLARTR